MSSESTASLLCSVNEAVLVARKEVFAGTPEDPRLVVSGTQCRTIRCRFILRSPFEYEPRLVIDALRRQTYDGEPLWRMVESEPTDPSAPHSPQEDYYVQVTVGVSVDSVNTEEIGFEAEKTGAENHHQRPAPRPHILVSPL